MKFKKNGEQRHTREFDERGNDATDWLWDGRPRFYSRQEQYSFSLRPLSLVSIGCR